MNTDSDLPSIHRVGNQPTKEHQMSSYFPKTITLRGQEITLNGSRGRVFIDDILRRKGGSQLQILVKNADGGETCVGYIPLPAWGYNRQRAWAASQGFEIA
jgi:hypothetical protein